MREISRTYEYTDETGSFGNVPVAGQNVVIEGENYCVVKVQSFPVMLDGGKTPFTVHLTVRKVGQ